MKRKFEELRENLDEFIEQNDYPVLVVGCLPDELAYVAKFFQALDEKHPADFVLAFPQPFLSAGGYLDLVAASLKAQLEAAVTLRAERGEKPFPDLPATVTDSRREPGARLAALLDYLRTLLPNEIEHRVAVAFLPLDCADFAAYARLVETVFPVGGFPPSMAALRVLVYDDRSKKLIANDLRDRQIDRVLTFDVDFSTPALTNALSVGAADTSLPLPERMSCLTQLAALDYSYKRYPDAIEKYGVLYRYYESVQLPSMQALCLLGTGDVLRASGQLLEAKEMLQRGLALALDHKALAMLLNGMLSIVELCFDLGHLSDAESYADSGSQVAAAALNPFAYADLLERKGDAQVAQGRSEDAVVSYGRARDIAKMYGYAHRSESVLPKLIAVYDQRGQFAERRDAERDLANAKAGSNGGAASPSASA